MCRDRKRRVTLISGTAHPDVINTVRTYCYGTGDELRVIPAKDGKTDPDALRELLAAGGVSGVCIQQPNFFGQLEDAEAAPARSSMQRARCISSAVTPLPLRHPENAEGVRRGYRSRRGTAARYAPRLGRPVSRLHGRYVEAHA